MNMLIIFDLKTRFHRSYTYGVFLRKSGLTPETTETRIIRYTFIQAPQMFSELTHFSLNASIYNSTTTNILNSQIEEISNKRW